MVCSRSGRRTGREGAKAGAETGQAGGSCNSTRYSCAMQGRYKCERFRGQMEQGVTGRQLDPCASVLVNIFFYMEVFPGALERAKLEALLSGVQGG